MKLGFYWHDHCVNKFWQPLPLKDLIEENTTMRRERTMKKHGIIRKITLATGLAIAVVAGVGMNSGLASAGTYLGPPAISLTPNGGFAFSVTSTTGTYTAYDLASSSYGDTIPTAAALNAAGITGTIESISGTSGQVFYSPSGLGLTQIASITDPYSATASNGSTFSGEIISNVMKVTTGSGTGDLVFTYQFDVTSVTPPGSGITGLSVSFFNEPLNLSTGVGSPWTLGDGINTTLVGNALSPPTSLSNINGSVGYDVIDGTIYSLSYSSPTAIGITTPTISPQFFVASNATNYTMGSLAFEGGGAGLPGEPVFVPGTPEPSTLVLLGTGFALLAFMAFRKRQNQIVI